MRIECPHCQQWGPARIEELGAGAVTFRCVACDELIEVSTVAEAASAPPGEVSLSEGHNSILVCPKCQARVHADALACKACGLAAQRFAGFESSPGPAAGSVELDEVWGRLLGDWDDESLHESFLERVAALGSYDLGAIRYREVVGQPTHQARARRMLKRIASMAAAALLTSRPKVAKAKDPFRPVVMLLIALVILAAIGGLYVTIKAKGEKGERKYRRLHDTTTSTRDGR